MFSILLSAAPLLPTQGATIVQENFSGSSLTYTQFSPQGIAPFEVAIDGGRLRTETDALLGPPPAFGVAAAILDGTSIPNYSRILQNAPGQITWSFDLEYFDGSLNSSYVAQLAMSEADRFSSTIDGYALIGGAFAGNEITLVRIEDGLVVNTVISSPAGPPPGESVQIQVDLVPSTGVWTLRMASLASGPPSPLPELGSGVDQTFLGRDLPYLSLGATTTGQSFYDNFSLEVIPEPGAAGLMVMGGLLLYGRRCRKRT